MAKAGRPLGDRTLFRKYNVEKLVRSAKGAGMEVGGVEVTPDGTIRVLAKDATGNASDYDKWDKATAKLQAR